MRFGATWIVCARPLFCAPGCASTSKERYFQEYLAASLARRVADHFVVPDAAKKTNAPAVFSYELTCRRCGWRTICGRDDAVGRLRLIGLLRREPDPDDELIAALLVEAAPRMTCPICKEKSLSSSPTDGMDDSDWQAAVLCEVCRAPISPERREAIPNAKRCARCQGIAETGQLNESEPDYCPNCGAIMEIRVSRGGGITRYKRFCTGDPPCRL